MADILSPAERSAMMSRIRSRNTKPELIVRSVLHRMGYRFRLHSRNLPGHPDIVLPRHKTVILVHGCFWHRHHNCRLAYTPKSRKEFWAAKFEVNQSRDLQTCRALRRLGWKVVTIWECQTSDAHELAIRLHRSLSPGAEQTGRTRGAAVESRLPRSSKRNPK
jgi:DNA mismatch endonuclease (patch repair protein)